VCLPKHRQLPCAHGVEQGVGYRFNLQTTAASNGPTSTAAFGLPRERRRSRAVGPASPRGEWFFSDAASRSSAPIREATLALSPPRPRTVLRRVFDAAGRSGTSRRRGLGDSSTPNKKHSKRSRFSYKRLRCSSRAEVSPFEGQGSGKRRRRRLPLARLGSPSLGAVTGSRFTRAARCSPAFAWRFPERGQDRSWPKPAAADAESRRQGRSRGPRFRLPQRCPPPRQSPQQRR
jgi:hypothetical protein